MNSKRFLRLLCLGITVLLLVFSLAACGGEATDYKGNAAEDMEFTDENVVVDGSLGGGDKIGEVNTTAKIIRNVSLYGETRDFDSAVESLKAKLSAVGGYVESSNTYGGETLSGGRRSARQGRFVMRIPAERLDEFLDTAEGLLNVTSFSESTKDVTLDYYDIKSRLDTLKAKKTALEAMLEKAEKLDEIMQIQDSLYDVIADIESYQSQLNVYDSKVSYSTVSLELTEVIEYTVVEEEDPTLGERIGKAFSDSWRALGIFGQGFLVFIAGAFPVLLILGGIAGIVLLIIWLVRRRKKSK
ncbi:MAG: DUF4349 domain-containing protein [Clostridia bacterium]|nr:DUF4349 domain-containing protein [Clostridia bacterium]